jgi:alpha-glucosidase
LREPPHGWTGEPPWLPFPPDAAQHSAEAQAADAGSTWHLYQAVLAARHQSPALRTGAITRRDAPDGVLAFQRRLDADSCTVIVNFTEQPVELQLEQPHVRLVDTTRAPGGTSYDGIVAAESALVLRATQS